MKYMVLMLFSAAVILMPYVDVMAGLSIYNIMLFFFMLAYVMTSVLKGDVVLDNNIFIMFILLSVAYVLVCVNPNIQGDVLSYKNIKVFMFPLVILIGISVVLKTLNEHKFFLLTLIISLAISTFVAVLQYFDIDAAWNLRMLIDVPEDKIVYLQINERIKPSGLAYFSVQLSYQIITFFPFVFYLYVIEKNPLNKRWIFILGVLVVLGALAINSVTAIMCIILSIMAIYKWPDIQGVSRIFKVAMYIIPVLLVLTILGFMDRVWSLDSSALSRVPMFIAGITMISEHPFGANYSEIANIKSSLSAQDWFISLTGSSQVIKTGLHNSFLTVAVQSGLHVFIIYLLIYGYTISLTLRQSLNVKLSLESRIFYRVSLIAVVAFIMQSSMHNAGLPTGDAFGWLLLGIIFSFDRILKQSVKVVSDKFLNNDSV